MCRRRQSPAESVTAVVRFLIAILAMGLTFGGLAVSQAPDPHAGHHPAAGGTTPAAPGAEMPMPAAGAPPASGPTAGAPTGGGMADMMGAMMGPKSTPAGGCAGGDCGSAAGATPLYPSLMTLPVLTPEKRAEIDALASQQIKEGMARLAKGTESLDGATRAGDEAGMQQSVGLMHEALNEFEAGIAARRVLSEGKAPRNLALDWFKREMSLASPVVRDGPREFLGVAPLHLFTMVLLVAFAFAMLAMYYFKMQRAAALFGRVEPDPKSPPPGSTPQPPDTPAAATDPVAHKETS